MRLPPPSQARASFSPRSQPPPVEEPPREEQEATPPSPPPEEVNSEPSERSEPFEEEPPQGNDPPGGAAPVSESLHATSEYPASDEEETIEEEIIEEEIVTDGEETIEEIIEEEEVTVGSMKEETIHEESHSGVEETIQENMERGGDPPPSPGAPPSPGGGDVDTAADATSPSLQKKPAEMDNDLAAFMERRRKAADGGGIIDDEQTEQTEPMGNLPKDEESHEEGSSRQQEEPEGQEPEEESTDREVVAAALAGAAAGAGASNYPGGYENEGDDMMPIQESDHDVEEDIQYDEPPVAAYQSAYDSQASPYQQQTPYGTAPVGGYDDDEEQPRDGKTDRAVPEEASSGPTWGLLLFVCCICCVLLAVGISLAVVLSDDDDGDRSAAFPTPSPVPGAPTTEPGPGSPTSQPTPTLNIPPGSGWVDFSGPFTGPVENIGYGSSVTMAGSLMAAGLPRYSEGLGAVQTFQKVGAVWEEMSTVFDRASERFGSDVDISTTASRSSMIVGASRTRGDGEFSNLSFGAGFYFEMYGGTWSSVGVPIRPEPSPFTSSGEFGAAVAVSASTRRIAVGAPNTHLNAGSLDNGRVYTYEYDGSNFVPIGTPIDGESAGDLLGSAVAMSEDGTKILIGAPGASGASPGSALYYSYTGNQWQIMLPVIGTTSDENLGSSVAIISSDGETIAMGAPNFDGGRGVVRVYRRNNPQDVFWGQLGPDIVGAAAGELLGTTLSGSDSRVVVGTALGTFKVYEYRSSSSSWVLVDSVTSTGSPVVAIATGSEGDVAVGLENEEVTVYGLF